MTDKPVVRTDNLLGATWFKSSYSGSDQSTCVEIADVRPVLGRVAVRDSKNPEGPALLITPKTFAQFTRDAVESRYNAR